MTCHKCGSIVSPDSRFCPACGELTGLGRFGKHQDKVESTNHVLYCANCGCANKSGKRFCTSCGSNLFITCPQCGNTNVMPSGYCPNCGHIMDMKPD